MGARLNARLGNLLVLLGSLALTAGALETGLRLFGPPPPAPEDSLSAFTEYDPLLGWRGRPGAEGHFRVQGYRIAVHHNRGGWRDDEPAPARETEPAPVAAGASPPRRIGLLGDSFAWGFGVERHERFDDRLEQLLPGWQVQNYGVSGYGPDQELLLLRQSVAGTRPDVVLVAFTVGNDLDTILASEAYRLPKPRFAPDREGLILENIPVPRVDDWDRRTNTGARDVLTEHVRLYAWIRVRWAVLKPSLRRMIGRPVRGIPVEARLELLSRREPSARIQQGWRLAEQILAAMQVEAAAVGARMMLLVVPDSIQVEDELWQSVVEQFQLDPAAYDRDSPNTILARIGRERGFAVVDPLPAMRRRAAQGVRVFLPDDPHWNAEGHRVAAEALAEALAP